MKDIYRLQGHQSYASTYERDPRAEYGAREAPIFPAHLSITPSGVLVSLDLLGGKKG